MPVVAFRWIAPAAALCCLLCTPAFAVDGVIEINQTCAVYADGCFPGDAPEPPVTITQPGSYVLTGNLFISGPNLDAIRIETNDVTLDLNGHTIQGPNTGGGLGNGIYALNRFNLTIRNGRIWGFGQHGIMLEHSVVPDPAENRSGARVEAMHLSNNGVGVQFSGGLLVDSTIDGNRGVGVVVEAGAVRSVTASRNSYGFSLARSSATNCTAVGNSGDGFSLLRSSLLGCAAIENGRYGVYMNHSSVTGCRVDDNGDIGIDMSLGAVLGGNHVFRNSASGNAGTDQIACPDNGTLNICVDNAIF